MQSNFSRRTFVKAGAAAALLTAMRPGFADEPVYKPAVPGSPAPPKTDYDEFTTAEEATSGLDLAGKTALVTGCNSGLGFETMRVLALRGAHVIGAARTLEKAEKACAGVDGKTTPLVIELTDFPGIVSAAKDVAAMDVSLDMLILNAGIMAIQTLSQANGVELQLAVNHLGHFLLTDRLRDQIVAADHGRVVVVSSGAHAWASDIGIEFDNLAGERDYDPYRAYGQSKLANGLFSRELARRLSGTNATSNSLHPGVIKTNLDRHIPNRDDEDEGSTPFLYKSIEAGAATQCFVATNPDLAAVTGWYFADCNPAYPNAHMQDDAMAKKLWQVSEDLTREYLS